MKYTSITFFKIEFLKVGIFNFSSEKYICMPLDHPKYERVATNHNIITMLQTNQTSGN